MLDYLLTQAKSIQGVTDDSEAIQKSLDRYDRIFRGSRGYGFLDWDLKTKRVHWQGGFWQHLGYDEHEMAKIQDAHEFVEFVHPDFRKSLDHNITKLITNKDPDDFIFLAKKFDGSYMWVELRIDAVESNGGEVTHLSGVVFDVSALKDAEHALKQSEARHARIIAASSDGIWEWSRAVDGDRMLRDEHGNFVWAQGMGDVSYNARCWEMLGYDSEDEIMEMSVASWRSRMHEGDGKLFDLGLAKHITEGEPFDCEYRIRGRDGEWRWIRVRGSQSYDEDGNLERLSGTNMDITELKQAQARVELAKEEAEKASRAKSEFLSSMSHELRTPLNAILGFAQLLELDAHLNAEQLENVHEIKAAGKHLLELVGDVLDLAKIESGHQTFSLEKVLVSRVVRECSTLLKSLYEEADVVLEVNVKETKNHCIYADPIRVKQVVLNLMSNAAKYNKKGGKVTVSAHLVGAARMRMSVVDTGRGIAKGRQPELFQPFNRLGADSLGVDGTGVGLVITKQLVEQMNGDIGYVSTEGVGTEFWVEFPLASEDGDVNNGDEVVDTSTLHVDDELPALIVDGAKKILYVEDNPSNQKLMRQVFARFPNLDLTVSELAVQGLYAARSTRPDLVILDVNMPGIDGYEIVEVLKNDTNTQDIPVVALSANVLPHDVKKGFESGFDEYLTKPMNLAKLIGVLNRFLK